jgi:putative aldouronate transport system permease protein
MYGITMAFKDFRFLAGIMKSPWAGFKHFETMFTGIYFWPAFRNTLIISTYKIIFSFPAPILLAILLNEVKHMAFKKTVQTITYLPHFISWVVLSGIVIEVLSPNRGIVNYIITLFGGKPIFFIGESAWFRPVLVISSIWKSIGFQSIIYLAAISGIDPELYDVAAIDGSGRIRKILSITIPSIFPVICIMLIFAIGGIINDDFDQVFNLLNGRVMGVGEVISTYTYRIGLERMEYSYSTAVGLFKNVISLVLIVVSNFASRKLFDSSLW